jgi:hypothetical protein
MAPSRPWLARGLLTLLVLALLVPTSVSAFTHETVGLGAGTVAEPADSTTYVGVQGFHFKGVGNSKKPARLVAAGPEAEGRVVTGGGRYDTVWFYDVDPLPNGDLLVTSTNPEETVVIRLDPEQNRARWTERLPYHDTHDVDLLPNGNLLVANMRETEQGVANDRLLVYDRDNDSVVWQWRFREHYPNSTDGGFSNDWTHLNDVDRVGEGRYLASPRNFDQVIVVDRETDDVLARLGEDDDHDVLDEQHNPDWLVSESGNATVLVADSENDRVVEYARRDGTWVRTWSVDGFNWPRDADRLPNGNTLVTDTLNHRVVEVRPDGTVVWEFYASWGPYDAERGAPGSNGPTMADVGATGDHTVSGGAGVGPASQATFSEWLRTVAAGSAFEAQLRWVADTYRHATPFLRPVWMSSWALAAALGALAISLVWATGELVYARARLGRALVSATDRLSRRRSS